MRVRFLRVKSRNFTSAPPRVALVVLGECADLGGNAEGHEIFSLV